MPICSAAVSHAAALQSSRECNVCYECVQLSTRFGRVGTLGARTVGRGSGAEGVTPRAPRFPPSPEIPRKRAGMPLSALPQLRLSPRSTSTSGYALRYHAHRDDEAQRQE